MTREEAIARIKDHMFIHKIYEERAVKITEELDMAISALQQSDHIADGGKKDDHLREVTKKVDTISRQEAIAVADYTDYPGLAIEDVKKVTDEVVKGLKQLPSAQAEYEPVTARDFAKTMSENTLYGFMAWHGEAFALMKEMGFEICKKTM